MSCVLVGRCRAIAVLALSLAMLASAGCGSDGGSRAQVKGKVVSNGQPVTKGSLTFMPVESSKENAARPGIAAIQSDGTFVAGTESASDGLAIGKHAVTFSAPPAEGPDWDGYGTEPPAPPFSGFKPKEAEIEVKAGTNEITIELMPGA